ncbi:MAG: hypothetical protein J0H43_00580 [Actinobacteria bacterium]|nr:hypothetical protein [Actinomycetota bacterium]
MVGVLPPRLPDDLVGHLVRTTDLSPAEAGRVIADVLTYYGQTPDEWIRRRHRELQRRGLTNESIFEQIAGELPDHRFRSTELSRRQLRRLVYG